MTTVGGAEKVHEKTPQELFSELYEKQNGQPMSDDQEAFLKGLVESIWED
jgi:exonuclease SbcD